MRRSSKMSNKYDFVPDDITREQFEEGMLRIELRKISHKRLMDWMDFHTKLFQKANMHPKITATNAVQMLTSMLAEGLYSMGVRPAQAADELCRKLAERYEEKTTRNTKDESGLL